MRSRIVIAALVAAVVSVVAIPIIAIGATGERGRTLTAHMTGKNEIGPDGERGAGDRNGLGSFTAIVDSGQLCFGLVVRDLDTPVAAHIHRGGSNANGAVVVPLTQPADGDPGASSACVAVEDSLATELLRRPSRFYVNVHTGPFPNGAVRGQLRVHRR